MGVALSLLPFIKKRSGVTAWDSTPQAGGAKDMFLAHKTKQEQRSVQENTLLNITAERIAERLAAFPRAEVRELPDDLLQIILEKAIELGTLRPDTLGCFSGAEGIWRLPLRDYPGVDDVWVALFAKSCELMVVDLCRCRALTDRSLHALAGCPTLRELHLGDAPALTDEGVRDLSHGLHRSLRALTLSNLPALTSTSLVHVGALLGLTQLALSKCPGLEGEGLVYLARLTGLGRLTLAWNLRATDEFLRNTPLPTHHAPSASSTSSAHAHAIVALPNLTQLELRSIRISDAALPWLRHRASLATLRLVNCKLTDMCLESIGSLPSLTDLDLSNNLITSNGLSALAPLTDLQRIQLNHCPNVSGPGLRVLRLMPKLQELCLDSCPLNDMSLGFLEQLTSLTHLDLSDTLISDATLAPLSILTGLRVLELGQTEVTDRGVRHLRTLVHLTNLNLDCRHVDDDALKLLAASMSRLEALDLYSACIGDDGLATICAAFPALKKLEICGGHLTNRGVEELPKLRNLRDLNLSHNKLGDRSLLFIAQCPRLSWLNLSHTKVTSSGLLALSALTRLRDLRLSSTRVDEAGIQALQDLCPQLMSVGHD